jgi:hypothetical protein
MEDLEKTLDAYLWNWAEFYRGQSEVSGYPSTSTIYKIMMGGLRANDYRGPHLLKSNPRAEEMEEWLGELKTISRMHRLYSEAVCIRYLSGFHTPTTTLIKKLYKADPEGWDIGVRAFEERIQKGKLFLLGKLKKHEKSPVSNIIYLTPQRKVV